MTIGERDQFNRFIRALDGISGELKGIRKVLERIAGDGAGSCTVTESREGKENGHREE